MAPILATAVGITPQIIDDPRLQQLLGKLNEFLPQPNNRYYYESSADVRPPLDGRTVEELVAVLEPHQAWIFEEQVRLIEGCFHCHLLSVRW